MEIVAHVSNDDLEELAMQNLPESETGPLEENLLTCLECRDRLDAEIEFRVSQELDPLNWKKSAADLRVNPSQVLVTTWAVSMEML